ncbi:hypothetical protein KFK09_019187 [Dendrobium nobile]|uniref:Carotenoid cleavage dioxygenase 7 n=1 Tax=Dendrobium nobile TaxID=94219 RepID=A0A8T3AXC8_DENNO|nr:hypothetical protein KFK09_019187 [Dendrobium nobile]
MQAAFHHRLLFFSQPLNQPTKTSKLFFFSTTTTPSCCRCISSPSASSNTPIPSNLPDSSFSSSSSSSATAAAAITAFEDYQRLFSSQPAESVDPLPLVATEGSLPADFPLGTYYLIGPGMISDDHGSTVNPLDGHGYLRAFRFIGGGVVMYSARYVETEAAKEEREAKTGEWRFRRSGIFSRLKSGWRAPSWTCIKNVANTTVLTWAGRLFCLWEGGYPYELEPKSLATVGPADFITAAERRQRRGGGGGVLNLAAGITKLLIHGNCLTYDCLCGIFCTEVLGKPPKRTMSHYKIDAQRNRLLILSCNVEDIILPETNFTFYEFDKNFELIQKKKYLISDQLMIHDWAFTDSYYIIMGNRIKTNILGTFLAISGLAPIISAISLNPSQPTTPIYLLPRFSNNTISRDWRIPIEAPSQLWTCHVGNAYEEKDGNGKTKIKIQASVCSYQWFNHKKLFGYDSQSSKLDPSFMNVEQQLLPHLVKISIELDAEGSCLLCSIVDSATQWKNLVDFPVINPTNSGKANRFMYACSTSGYREFLPHFPFDIVVKFDFSNGIKKSLCTESRKFIGEPMFISKNAKDEEDGYIVVIEYAVFKQKCYLVVLDAKRIGYDDAIVVKLEVPKHLTFPFGFHGFWDEKCEFFDVGFGFDDTIEDYLNRILPTLVDVIDDQFQDYDWILQGHPSPPSPPPPTSPWIKAIGVATILVASLGVLKIFFR